MIGFFTDPYPDELLYSICARYHHRAGYPSIPATMRDLFGDERGYVVVDFPTRLAYLAGQLPATTYSADRLIDEHTMLPLYLPFVPPDRRELLRSNMRGNVRSSLHASVGILTSRIDVKYLRFCPMCVDDDRSGYGEPYWHRLHQAPGVEICIKHSVFLANSDVRTRVHERNPREGHILITAKNAIGELSAVARTHQLDPKDQQHIALLKLARDAEWILSGQISLSDEYGLRSRYLQLLLKRHLATYAGSVNHARLKSEFLAYHSPELLERLSCDIGLLRSNWLRRLITYKRGPRHPLYHLLLMQFLECTAKEFFQLSMFEPFGEGPWPCLNAAGGHYGHELIANCEIGHTQDKGKRLMGTFRCECGFSYRRIGPDETDARRYEFDQIRSFGDAWYAKLRELISRGDQTPAQIAQALGVSFYTAKAEISRIEKARKANAPMKQRYGPRSLNGLASKGLDVRDIHRGRWSKIVAENPKANRTALRGIEPLTYSWLLKNDKQWFEDNSPRRTIYGGGGRWVVDWSKRDKEHSATVFETAERLLTAPGRPVRVSHTKIAREVGIVTLVRVNAGKLPLTMRALEEKSETATSFAIRRIRWAADCYRKERIPAKRWQLKLRAGVNNTMACKPTVRAAFDEDTQALREMNEQGWGYPASGSSG